jgi:hypothetical protein
MAYGGRVAFVVCYVVGILVEYEVSLEYKGDDVWGRRWAVGEGNG